MDPVFQTKASDSPLRRARTDITSESDVVLYYVFLIHMYSLRAQVDK